MGDVRRRWRFSFLFSPKFTLNNQVNMVLHMCRHCFCPVAKLCFIGFVGLSQHPLALPMPPLTTAAALFCSSGPPSTASCQGSFSHRPHYLPSFLHERESLPRTGLSESLGPMHSPLGTFSLCCAHGARTAIAFLLPHGSGQHTCG